MPRRTEAGNPEGLPFELLQPGDLRLYIERHRRAVHHRADGDDRRGPGSE
jgi:hypothetical protein